MKRYFGNQHGVGLIEVLVTLLILSTTLIALSSLQTRSLQFNQGAYFRSQANMLAYDMLDRIRVNDARGSAKEAISAYTMPETAYDPNASIATSPLSAVDKSEWMRSLGVNLPGVKGKITCDNTTRICAIEISWKELNASGLASEDKTTFSYEARI